jgi:DUF4097 and DUF4098 domain-containing protein YvlB
MNDQETYDRTVDPPSLPPPGARGAVALPNEPYYQQNPPNRRARNASLGVALVLVGLALLAFQVFGHTVPIGGSGTIPLVDQRLPGDRIELTAAASDVEVRVWNGSDIRVEATQRGGSRGDYTIDVNGAGDTVRVSESSARIFCIFCSSHVSYRISVPSGATAEIKTASGEIDVAELGGAVTLNTVSGDIRANDLKGGLAASTTSGEVQIDNLRGPLTVNTVSGDVQLDGGEVSDANVNTTSGQVELSGVSGQLTLGSVSGDVRVRDAHNGRLAVSTTSGGFEYAGDLARGASNTVNSISGDVKLALPDNTGLRLDASTVSGSISSEFDLSNREEGLRSLKGTAGDGGTTLTIGTTSGDISVEKR